MTDKRNNPFLWMVIIGGVLFILAGLVLVMLNQPADVVKTPTPASVQQVPRISVEEAKTKLDNGSAVFIDVRDRGSYENAHIPGALNIPINELTEKLSELDPSTWIITYCT